MWTIETVGSDCLGNISGYRVVKRGSRGTAEYGGTFVGNIYTPGSFEHALWAANARCADLARIDEMARKRQGLR